METGLNELKKEMLTDQTHIKEQINIKDEVLSDKIKQLEEQFIKEKAKTDTDLEAMKAQLDVIKISYTVNDKQLMERIQTIISSEIRNACSDKEQEILMTLWIRELKEILSDFEKKIKKLTPKEFMIRLDEILESISVFKQRIIK